MNGKTKQVVLTIDRELYGAEVRAQRRQIEEALHDVGECTGTGIGLSSVQRVVRGHARPLWEEGKVESDVTFCFTMSPFASAASGKNDAALQSPPEVGL